MIVAHYREANNNVGLVSMIEFEAKGVTQADSVMVTDVPDPEILFGKTPVIKIDLTTNTIFYEYMDRPLTDQERIQQLEEQVAQLLSK